VGNCGATATADSAAGNPDCYLRLELRRFYSGLAHLERTMHAFVALRGL
jgi:hypothetical protein